MPDSFLDPPSAEAPPSNQRFVSRGLTALTKASRLRSWAAMFASWGWTGSSNIGLSLIAIESSQLADSIESHSITRLSAWVLRSELAARGGPSHSTHAHFWHSSKGSAVVLKGLSSVLKASTLDCRGPTNLHCTSSFAFKGSPYLFQETITLVGHTSWTPSALLHTNDWNRPSVFGARPTSL